VVHAYEEWGVECLNHFRGMFAFSLWDSRQRTLFIARDRMGVKPVYYWDSGARLVWGSEAKVILLDPDYERRPNLSALGDFLRFRFVPAPATFFVGIRKLLPGHYLLCGEGRPPNIVQYWDIPRHSLGSARRTEQEYAAELRERLLESVKMQLVSEVSLGAFLSGGIDSSAIVGLMSQLANEPVKTFSVGFGVGEPVDELNYARRVARYFNSDHHELIVEPSSFDILSKIIWHLDEPVADSAVIPTYLLSRYAREFVTVVLTGEGADELLAGYRKYYWNKVIGYFRRLPVALRRVVLAGLQAIPISDNRRKQKLIEWASAPDNVRLVDMMSDLSLSEVSGLITPEAAEALCDDETSPVSFDLVDGSADGLTQMLYLDAKTCLPDDLLIKVDKMTMAASLEARVPFLDHEIVEFAMSVPSEFKLKGDLEKHLLRCAMGDLLPIEITRRRKHVFMVPFDQWFKGDLNAYLADILTDPRTDSRGFVNRPALERLLREFQYGQLALSQPLFTLLVLELWSRVFLDSEGDGAALRIVEGRTV
jgi:asparagine synthase (glutamine-hydrolysing)